MFEIKKISPLETYNIRHTVLRPHQNFEDCKNDTDYDNSAFHIGAFYQGRLVSVASFCVDNHPDFPIDKQYRLRAMATLDDYRKLGAGRLIVNYAEDLIKELDASFLWCKGRTSVQEYYEKLGFKAHGDVFDYPPIGPHII
ncbi:MAG TPA: GNAT family N-acetyltransferase, partial [Tissierellaceae bacterium]|nr:GNAT family N-acetyltransferase [Tissierellaceae bacterium]